MTTLMGNLSWGESAGGSRKTAWRRLRPILFSLLSLLLQPSGLSGAAAAEEANAELSEEDFTLPTWSISSALSLEGGYRDNVLLSAENPDGSAFLRGGAETMFLRVPEQGLDGYVFLSLTETRYLAAEQSEHERTGFLNAEIRWQANDVLKFGVTGLAYHQDEVLDVSVDQASLNTAQLKVTGGSLAPFVTWTFAPDWWLRARGTGRQDHFAQNIDGYTQGEGSLVLGRRWESGSELTFTAAGSGRSHDSREQFTESGRPISGSRLKSRQTELALKYTLVPDQAKRWRVILDAGQEKNHDNGSGYFDFTRRLYSAAVAWQEGAWDVNLSAGFSDYDFPVQLVGIGIAPENRHKKEYRLTLEATRLLTPTLSLLAGYESERAVSNDDRSRFRINTAYVGLKWTWDNLGIDQP